VINPSNRRGGETFRSTPISAWQRGEGTVRTSDAGEIVEQRANDAAEQRSVDWRRSADSAGQEPLVRCGGRLREPSDGVPPAGAFARPQRSLAHFKFARCLVGGDDPVARADVHQHRAAEFDDRDAFDVLQDMMRFEQAGVLVRWQINLRFVAVMTASNRGRGA